MLSLNLLWMGESHLSLRKKGAAEERRYLSTKEKWVVYPTHFCSLITLPSIWMVPRQLTQNPCVMITGNECRSQIVPCFYSVYPGRYSFGKIFRYDHRMQNTYVPLISANPRLRRKPCFQENMWPENMLQVTSIIFGAFFSTENNFLDRIDYHLCAQCFFKSNLLSCKCSFWLQGRFR